MSELPSAAETELVASVEQAVSNRPKMRPMARRYVAYDQLYQKVGMLPAETMRTIELAVALLPAHLKDPWTNLVHAYQDAYDASRIIDD
jgi:hypothetical protein